VVTATSSQNNIRKEINKQEFGTFDMLCRVKKKSRMRWAGHVARIGKGRGVYSVLVGKPEGKRPLGRPRRGWDVGVWTGLSWLRIEACGGLL
jgi:hypothetical protein